MFRFLVIPALLTATLHAQIYADFTVSKGGNPLGTFTVTLAHQKAPRTCSNFIGLATGKRPWVDVKTSAVRTNTPYYNGQTFHRLIHSFVIQGGSPNGQGTDGPGYSILDEYDPTLRHSSQYVLSMAKSSQPNTGGSQFFITLRATPELDNKHSVFGTVTSGTAIIDSFKDSTLFPTGASDKPLTNIVMDSVVIYGPDYDAFDTNAPSLRLPEVNTTNFTPVRNAATGDFKLVFDRRAKTDYLFQRTVDLANWTSASTLFSFDSASALDYNFGVVTAPKFFVNGATIRYDLIPDAIPDLISGEKTLRIHYPNGTRLELTFTPMFSVWSYEDGSGNPPGGQLSNFQWNDRSPGTGFLNLSTSQAHRLPLGQLIVSFDGPAGPEGLSSLNTWLSFHTENSGWLEEISGNFRRRLPFEILSN